MFALIASNTALGSTSKTRPQNVDTTMDMPPDSVTAQLRKLREGVGLTAARLNESGAVMSALGTADPKIGLDRLIQVLDGMGDSDSARALRADFGLDLPALLNRQPATREREWLGDRRDGYGAVIGRDAKTLARWSNKSIDELRSQMIADQFTGHLYVVAAVKNGVVQGISMIQEELDQLDGVARRTSTDVDNPSHEPSLPALIYGYPRDWRPASLTLVVTFLDGDKPASACALVADNFFSLVFGAQRHPLKFEDDTVTCRFERLRTDRLYAITWLSSGSK